MSHSFYNFILMWTLTWNSSHISIHKTENWTKQVFCGATPGISTWAVNDGPANGKAAFSQGLFSIHLSNQKKKYPKEF